MYRSERKSIFYVLGLYLSSTFLLIITLFGSYYYYKYDELLHFEEDTLKEYSAKLQEKLFDVHENSEEKYLYPRFQEFKSAIYDSEKKLIFSTLETTIKNLDTKLFFKDSKIYSITSVNPHYLGAAFMVIEKEKEPLNILNNLIAIALFVLIVTLITSYFLVKAVLKPLRDNLRLLDDFIKETTHELNTPITTIMTNIETLESNNCDRKSMKKLQRIKSASATISNLYDDLVYLHLNHKVSSQNEKLDISQILHERISYFTFMAHAKKLTLKTDIEEGVLLYADKKKIEKLIDNIVSNAIKYTNKATTITIFLRASHLFVLDEGNGMNEKEIGMIFQKYTRFDKTQGGFGIGYSIIKSIVDEYNIDIEIESEPQKGTKVTLRW
ncbi:MAG: HAMP domain-containing sensor histidine kinase [Sulfurimonadaceae bacterium]|nr:HAMP domain-containing sensor histidine kinase [Sulfurimonadaceae bacterium]